MIQAGTSLIKYETPRLISKAGDRKGSRGKPLASPRRPPASGPAVDGINTTTTSNQKHQTEEILNALLPPREWSEDGSLWVQSVSCTPATRSEVTTLKEALDTRLQQRQARETGICPVRRELYKQVFDELIRQVTIECTERGVLLLRVRDEISMTLNAYQTLYESSVAFGMRKALQAEQGKADMAQKILDLEEEKKKLEHQLFEAKAKYEALEKREAERRVAENAKHTEEVTALKRANQQLKTQLEGIISPGKK